MAGVSTYLNFDGTTEAAFEFYKSVFGTEYESPIYRFGDMPPQEGMPPLSDAFKDKVLNVSLPIAGGHILMGTDAMEGMGHPLVMGTNVHIMVHTDSRDEADALFAKLSDGGQVEMPMADMFWGSYYGSFRDKFGLNWMINFGTAQ